MMFGRVIGLLVLLSLVSCVNLDKQLKDKIAKHPFARLKFDRVLTRIQFGSCSDQRLPQPLWRKMLEANPDLYLALGDNVYTTRKVGYAQAYLDQLSIPEFIQFRKKVPVLATWDDHDYGANDSGKENPHKNSAKEYFLKFWPDGSQWIDPNHEGIFHSLIVGPPSQRVQIILLDTRSFRDELRVNKEGTRYVPHQDSQTSLLGKRQWAWLQNQFAEPVDLRILASSIQVLSDQHGGEKWGNFPHERERLLDMLDKTRGAILIISGDRHHGEISSIELESKKIIEVTSSGINRDKASRRTEENHFRKGKPVFNPNFGQINIDWQKRSVAVKISDQDYSYEATPLKF